MGSSVEQFQLVEAVDGTVEDLKEYVRENQPDHDELVNLLNAEEVHKDRKTAKNFLKRQIDSSDLDKSLEQAEKDVEEIREAIEKVESIENVPKPASPEEISRPELLEAVDGTVEELEDFVRYRQLGREQLQDLLDAEESLKNRKTAKNFLRDQISEQKLAEDIESAEEDLEELEMDVKELDSDTRVGEAMKDIGERSREKTGKLAQAMRDIASGATGEKNEDRGKPSGSPGEKGDDTERAEPPGTRKPGAESEEEKDAGPGDREAPGEGESPAAGSPVEEDEEEEEDGDTEEEESKEESEEEQEEQEDELEEKREIAEELDVDVPDDELRELSIEELERLRDEKAEREQLIGKLEDEFDEEILRKASLEDLRKLRREHSGTGVEEERQEEKDREEMEVEAEEDLQMLMGAVSRDEDTETEESLRDQLKDFGNVRTRVREIFRRGADEGEEEKKMRKKKVLELLDDYQDLETEEAAIKTAHIVKGYLEYKLEIEREMTYGELADELRDRDGSYMEDMVEFFESMAKDEYADTIDEEKMESIVDTAEKVVKAV